VSAAADLSGILNRLETFGVRLGLETTHRLLAALGDPQKDLRVALVAGTNGKGSTAALLASMATAAGYRTGLYTSPHLETVEERLRIDGRAITNSRLTATVSAVVTAAEDRLGYLPTYFEALTAASCLWFAEEAVDLAVLEVGLGGRLDATNGTDPLLSLITEIGLEHQKYLGDTLSQIGREKAGILRSGKDAVAWVERREARDAIQQVADETGARLVWGPDVAAVERLRDLGRRGQAFEVSTPEGKAIAELHLPGEHQGVNLALAVLGAQALARGGFDDLQLEAIVRGAEKARWPGRLEWVEPPGHVPLLLDVAHNPDGARTLAKALAEVPGKYTLLFGALADKEVAEVLPILAEKASRVILTSPQSDRAMAPDDLIGLVDERKAVVEPDRVSAVDVALESAADYVVVCGSVYLVGNVRKDLRRRVGLPLPATDLIYDRGG
jgi:dihydrofolate synthase/folylpolyglutamate synthase